MDNSRLFLYAALAFVSLLLWEQWKADYDPKPPAPIEQSNTQNGAEDQALANQNNNESLDLPESAAIAPAGNQSLPSGSFNNTATSAGQNIRFETDVFEGIINTRGGVITSVKLKQYPEEVDQPEQYLELIHLQKDSRYVIQTGLRSSASAAPTHLDSWVAAKTDYNMASDAETLKIPLVWSKDGVQVTKTFEFKRGDYLVNINHLVENQSGQDWQGSQYRQIQRSRPLETSKLLYTYTGAVVYNDEIKYEKVDFDDMESKSFKQDSKGGWAAMIQHYFLSAFVAEPDQNNLMYSLSNTRHQPALYTIGMRSDSLRVANGTAGEFETALFVGPKLVNRLEEISPGLDLTVDYGFLTFLSKPLYWLLSMFHGWVGNWGFAIILLTLLVKAVFFKLSEASYKSMAKMRKVAPRLKTLKERYGDDRQKMNQAMMEMYKEEKINPLGGCLPILLQIPVFIALYWALLESVELRQAPFILWINDLSVMDPYFVLPLIMGVSMFIQQKLNPAPPDPIQAKVMMALPLVFMVFFAFFPAGLVLYWVVNNILSIAQQWVITKRIEAGQE